MAPARWHRWNLRDSFIPPDPNARYLRPPGPWGQLLGGPAFGLHPIPTEPVSKRPLRAPSPPEKRRPSRAPSP